MALDRDLEEIEFDIEECKNRIRNYWKFFPFAQNVSFYSSE